MVVILTACLLVRTAWTMYYHLLYEARGPMLGDWLIGGVIVSAYTAALAPFAFRALLSMSRLLGIRTPLSSPLGKGGGRGVASRGQADV